MDESCDRVDRSARRTTLMTEAVIGDTPSRLTDRDPLAGSSWSDARTVEGFVQSPPNTSLMDVAAAECRASARLLDIGCGAGRNAVPLARSGWRVVGTDLSSAMLTAAASRVKAEGLSNRMDLVLAAMEPLPFAANTFDFIVAHGIWNLARLRTRVQDGRARSGARGTAGSSALPVHVFPPHARGRRGASARRTVRLYGVLRSAAMLLDGRTDHHGAGRGRLHGSPVRTRCES